MLTGAATATQITHRDRLWLYGLVTLIMAFLIVPCLIVIPMSFSDSHTSNFPREPGARGGSRRTFFRENGARLRFSQLRWRPSRPFWPRFLEHWRHTAFIQQGVFSQLS
jgi:hypothetical protein